MAFRNRKPGGSVRPSTDERREGSARMTDRGLARDLGSLGASTLESLEASTLGLGTTIGTGRFVLRVGRSVHYGFVAECEGPVDAPASRRPAARGITNMYFPFATDEQPVR